VTTKNALVLDLMGTTAAGSGLVSLLLYQSVGETRFDGVGAMVIGVTTAILALVLIIGVKGFLIGKRAAPQIEEKIKKAVLTVPQVNEILDLRTMQIGPDKLLVNIEVNLQDQLTTDELETLIDKIKKRVHEKVPSIQHVQVELETPE
jgi:divalent metal cation (Fe/Co/Zn/Cd) transporter